MESNAINVEVELRPYRENDENRITQFLNLCYGNWGDLEKWEYLYIDQPMFSKSDVTIAEANGQIIGYGGMHGRYLALNGKNLLVQLLGDGAVNSAYRGMRLHSKLLKERFKRAGDNNACLCLGWVLRNSDAYKSDMRVGFVEARQFSTYLKILNYGNVLRAGMADLLAKNRRLYNSLLSIGYPIYFKTGTNEFPLLNTDEIGEDFSQGRIIVHFSESAIKEIYNFRSLNTKQRMVLFAKLLLFRKMKVYFPSFNAFLSLLKKSGTIAKSL